MKTLRLLHCTSTERPIDASQQHCSTALAQGICIWQQANFLK